MGLLVAAAGHRDDTADVLSPSRNDSYLKGNRPPEVCAFWTSTAGESLLTQRSEPTSPFFMLVTSICLCKFVFGSPELAGGGGGDFQVRHPSPKQD